MAAHLKALNCFHQRRPSAKFHYQHKQVSLSNNSRHRRIQACPCVLPPCGPAPTVTNGADPAPTGHGLMRKLRSVEAGALAIMHTNLQSACFVKGASAGFSQVGTHTSSSAMSPKPTPARCHKRATKTQVFEARNLFFVSLVVLVRRPRQRANPQVPRDVLPVFLHV